MKVPYCRPDSLSPRLSNSNRIQRTRIRTASSRNDWPAGHRQLVTRNLGAACAILTRKSHFHLSPSDLPIKPKSAVVLYPVQSLLYRGVHTWESDQNWVPPAYRGAPRERTARSDDETKLSPTHHRQQRSRPTSRHVPQRHNSRSRPQLSVSRQSKTKTKTSPGPSAAERRQRKEQILKNQYGKLQDLAIKYKKLLMAQSEPEEFASSIVTAGNLSVADISYHLGQTLMSLHIDDRNKAHVDVKNDEQNLEQPQKTDDMQQIDETRIQSNDQEVQSQVSGDPLRQEADVSSRKANQVNSDVNHLSFKSVTWDQIMETEHTFGEISHLLRELVTTCTSSIEWERDSDDAVSESNSFVARIFDLLDLSMTALESLDQIRRDRKILVESVPPPPKKEPTKEKNWISSVQTFVQSFFIGPKEQSKQQDDDDYDDYPPELAFAHNSPTPAASLEMYQCILRPMLFGFAGWLSQPSASLSSSGQVHSIDHSSTDLLRQASNRLIRIISLLSEQDLVFSSLDLIQKQKIMTFLSRAGTLESAAWCNRVYRSTSDASSGALVKQGIHEMIVWNAFVEAAKNTYSPMEERKEAVRRLFRLWLFRWNNDFPVLKNERFEQVVIVMSAIASVADGEEIAPSAELKEFSEVVVRRVWGRDFYGKFLDTMESGKDMKTLLRGRDLPLINELARLFSCYDLAIARTLIEALLHENDEHFPTLNTVERYLKTLLNYYYDSGMEETDRNPVSDVDFAMLMLDRLMSKRDAVDSPSQETFQMISKLLTVVTPPNVGQHFLTWLSHLELRYYLDDGDAKNVKIAQGDYNRVLWGFWQEVKSQSPDGDQDQLRWCQRAWDLLLKMDSLSTPLLMSVNEARHVKRSRLSPLYLVDSKPTKRAYEIVLNICADTPVKSEFKDAANILLKVLALAERDKVELSSDLVDRCSAACKAKLMDTQKQVSDDQ
ncbi:hypothetical protein ACA910_002432 [Epithemia clementina (nom. ined.)]